MFLLVNIEKSGRIRIIRPQVKITNEKKLLFFFQFYCRMTAVHVFLVTIKHTITHIIVGGITIIFNRSKGTVMIFTVEPMRFVHIVLTSKLNDS